MASIKIPGLVPRPRAAGVTVFYWQPWPAAAALGFAARPLRRQDGTWMDEFEAAKAARAIVDELERVRADQAEQTPRTRAAGRKDFEGLVQFYRRSERWRDELAEATKAGYAHEIKTHRRGLRRHRRRCLHAR